MTELDVWTVSIMLRTEHGRTRADAFLQSPDIDLECSACTATGERAPSSVDTGEEVAAAQALENLSRRLVDRAARSRARAPTERGP
jgi:hypothetical protein